MSAAVVSGDLESDRHRTRPLTFQVGASLAIVGSLMYVSLGGKEPRDAWINPVGVVGAVVGTVACILLSYALVQWRTTLPRWAVLTSAVGIWFAGACSWSYATLMPGMADATSTPAEFDDLVSNDFWMVVFPLGPKSLLCLVGFLAIAIAGWRSRAIPRSACVFFGIGAILSIWPPYPPGLIMGSIALLIVARSESLRQR